MQELLWTAQRPQLDCLLALMQRHAMNVILERAEQFWLVGLVSETMVLQDSLLWRLVSAQSLTTRTENCSVQSLSITIKDVIACLSVCVFLLC